MQTKLKKKESKMKLVKCRRNGNKIITLGLDKANSTKTYASVNQAKRESRKLQIAVGGLGCGVLEVV